MREAHERNPGPWARHSELVATAARIFASEIDGLDDTKAYLMGLLHDIGRRTGPNQTRHALDGYNYLKAKGYEELARICITHCFPNSNANANTGLWDCTEQELAFVKEFLSSYLYDDYDYLIILCDCVTMEDCYVLIEKRLLDVALRYGLRNRVPIEVSVLEKWQKIFEIKNYFEQQIGKSIYALLPGVAESTFNFT
ncbi:MAG: HD domain-containing protein [Candidatus Odinarchaeota archaeon]